MARIDRAGAVRSGEPILWYPVAAARSVANAVDQVRPAEPTQALSLDVPAVEHLAELIIYTPAGRRRRLPVRGAFDRAA